MCSGFEARLRKDGRLRETGRASSATGYSPQKTRPVFVCCGVGGEEESLKDAANRFTDVK